VGTLKERGILLTYDEKATRWLAHNSVGKKSGARDLRNLIRRQVEDKIASLIVENSDSPLSAVSITADEKAGIRLGWLKEPVRVKT
ncbi:MAG TPA: hypothetical protein DEP64_02375, partial [Ruminococcaceae bacterium]|nr:hypothetical protein [Oscillospiraceae bacterium]